MKRALNRRIFIQIVLLVVFPSLAFFPVNGFSLTASDVFEKVKDSIVVVKRFDDKGKLRGQGSGVLLPSGHIATNCHVVEKGSKYKIVIKHIEIPAFLYAGDDDRDICLLDANGIQGKPVQIGDTVGLKIGAAVYAVGAPQGLELTLSDGIISQLRGSDPPLIQTTAAISPGSSGGGLFDDNGKLIGLTTLYIKEGQGLNFAIPVEWLKEIINKNNNIESNIIRSTNKRIEWGKQITLTGVVKFDMFDNCCFEGKSKKTRYAYIIIDNEIDLIENDKSMKEWDLQSVKTVQVALTSEVDKLSNDEKISVHCKELWQGTTMHYALPVYCYEPTILKHTPSPP